MAIAIGSVPHKDIDKALDLIAKYLPEAPIWPQLPKLSLNESMTVQYTEGMPCIKIDRENNKAYFDTGDENYIDEVSERFGLALEDKYEEFKISSEFAKGFYALKERFIKDLPKTVKILKGHVTGPISFGLSMHDETGKSILYNDNMRDVVIKILALKAKWQVNEFLKINKDITPMIFFDEPYLTQIGTPFVSIQRDEAVEMLNTCLDEVEGIKGIHICGNTDWALVTDTHTDIINFDAYAYPETLSLYPEEIGAFLKRGGMIAWGVTPSTEAIAKEDKNSILAKFENAVELLCNTGVDKDFLLRRSFISPSCGTGSLPEELAENVFKLNYEVSNIIREKHF
jgi:methionine synthase II (cobalamin-independent)